MTRNIGHSSTSEILSTSTLTPDSVLENRSRHNAQKSAGIMGHSMSSVALQSQVASAEYMASSTPMTLPTKKRKPRKRQPEELDIMNHTAARFASRLSQDHARVLHPDVDSPFTDYVSAIQRLLPYHVFQQPKEDLYLCMSGKGKGTTTNDELKAEIEETKFALECYRRREALQNRFRKIKTKSGRHVAPDDQAYVLAQLVLDADRAEMAWLGNELRTARAELDKIEKDKRSATHATRISQFSTHPAMHAQYYRTIPYAYTQAYGTPTQISSTSTFSVAPSPVTNTPVTGSSGTIPYQVGAAIPVQLPVASLPVLHSLGITPVPAASLPHDAPAPPAILRGSTANGTMLSLEINVSLLQSAQMSGLAMMLNSLMSRSNGGTSAHQGRPPTTSIGATPKTGGSAT